MFSLTTEYALRAAVWLAEKQGLPQTTQQIASATCVPVNYLSKVLQSLGKAGLVRALRGKHGGFELAKSPSSTSVLGNHQCRGTHPENSDLSSGPETA